MKIKRIEQICFENELPFSNLLIEFIKRITDKNKDYYGKIDWIITEPDLIKWVVVFKSGDPVRLMSQTEKKKFISVIIHMLED